MPKKMEQALRREAAQRGYGKERTNAYVYGTMRNRGMLGGNTPSRPAARQGMLPRPKYK